MGLTGALQYPRLGKEMRAQRKSFAISTGDTEVLKQLSKQAPSESWAQKWANSGAASFLTRRPPMIPAGAKRIAEPH